MASCRKTLILSALFVGYFGCVGFFCQQACAVGPLEIPDDVKRVLALRYPRTPQHLRLIQGQVQRTAKHVMPATIGVIVGGGMGSGVIINADGLVLTAAHVIGRAGRRATLLLPDGRKLRGRTLGANHGIDAGLVQITNPPDDLPFLPEARSLPKVGDWVITTGHPGGVLSDRSPPLRLGRVLGHEDDWICTDCTLVGGDSGGPLVNLRGEVLAVHSSIGSEIIHNFHVPVVEIRKDWDRLLAGEVWGREEDELATSVRPMIGVAGETKAGSCRITEVFEGLPAYAADIRVGDIVQFLDGDKVTSFEALSKMVRLKRPGQTVELQILRDGKSFEIEIRLAGVRVRVPKAEQGDIQPREKP